MTGLGGIGRGKPLAAVISPNDYAERMQVRVFNDMVGEANYARTDEKAQDGCADVDASWMTRRHMSAVRALDRKPPVTYIPPPPPANEVIRPGVNFVRSLTAEVQISSKSQRAAPVMNFADAGIVKVLLVNVQKAGYAKPTAIQQYALPNVLAGRDLMGCARTGSGKTAAYLLPILSSMLTKGQRAATDGGTHAPVAIILVPTRELAVQICAEARRFAGDTFIQPQHVYGGVQVAYQVEHMVRGCDVLIGTPGRINQFVDEGRLSMRCCRYFVLDEADQMLDYGFESDIRRLEAFGEMAPTCRRQTLMFSATFPDAMQKLAKDFLNANYVFVAVGKVGGANEDITQVVLRVGRSEKKDKILELLHGDMTKDDGRTKKTLVFVERRQTADFIGSRISQDHMPTTTIHGDRYQKEREEALADFKGSRCPVLVATGVAARGIDIVGVDHVINYDMPTTCDEYVHRIGRTGRVGNPGRATSFFDGQVDEPLVPHLVKVLTDANQLVPHWIAEQRDRAVAAAAAAAAAATATAASTAVLGAHRADFGATADQRKDEWG